MQREGHDYWVCTNASTFDEGRTKCKAVGLDLATINDAAENQFLTQVAGQETFIGLTDQKVEGAWRWVSENKLTWCGDSQGQPTSASSFTSWANGEPEMPNCQFAAQAGRAYWFCNDQGTFDAARSACSAIGMSLARVDNSAEKSFIASKLSKPAWLGATDVAKDGDWRWLDGDALFWTGGSTGQAVGGLFSNWGSGDPHASDSANCLSMSNGAKGYWFSEKCDKANTWVCEGPAVPQGPIPDVHDCTVIRDNGDWGAVTCSTPAAYICETVDTEATKTIDEVAELIRDEYRAGKPTVSYLRFAGGTSVKEPFLHYGERLGLRDCVDTVEPSKNQPSPVPGETEAVRYDQVFNRIPVYGRGYTVHRDGTTGAVKSFSGRFEHNIDLDTTPLVSETKAFAIATNAVAVKAASYGSNKPAGLLAVFPTRQGPSAEWELAWLFELPVEADTFAVAVSATSGAVLFQSGSVRTQVCPSVDVTGQKTTTDIAVTAPQQVNYGDPYTARVTNLGIGFNPYALYAAGVASAPSPLADKPEIRALCPGGNYPFVVGVDSNAVTTTGAVPWNNYAAALYLSAQHCVKYLAHDFEWQAGVPWIGYDGIGSPIEIMLVAGVGSPVAWNGIEKRIRAYTGAYLGASTESVCHEVGHGIFNLGQGEVSFSTENYSVSEGFGDVIGAAAEMYTSNSYPGPPVPTGKGSVKEVTARGWCVLGDPDNKSCWRDLEAPRRSSGSDCEVRDGSGTTIISDCPADYFGPDYCPYIKKCTVPGENACCVEHGNSTVLSHWFYKLAQGDSGTNAKSCPYQVAALDPNNLANSVSMAARILFEGTRTYAVNTGFKGMATATITAAEKLYPGGIVQKRVMEAWFGVGVVEETLLDSSVAAIEPEREAPDVYPWITFYWPIHAGEKLTGWDFQISEGGFFDAAHLKFGTFVSGNSFTTHNGKEAGYLKLALPFSSKSRYFWRTRPHSTDAWEDCYPIHSFVRTGGPPKVQGVGFEPPDLTDPSKVQPGAVALVFPAVKGAENYHIFYSHTKPPKCTVDSEITKVVVPAGSMAPGGPVEWMWIHGILPEAKYWISIKPEGPNGFDGKPSLSDECLESQFETGALGKPFLTTPDGQGFDYHVGATLSFGGTGEPSSYELRLFPINESGACETASLPVIPVVSGAFGVVAPVELKLSLPNPTGYCWQVTSVAANGVKSQPSDVRKFIYSHASLPKVSPGLPEWQLLFYREPAPLPGDSWGQGVTFSWQHDPGGETTRYGLKVGRWPWETPGTGGPPNCLGGCAGPAAGQPSHEEVVNGTSRTFDKSNADWVSMGRYCWSVWPILPDPSDPSKSWTRQPLVDVFPPTCYTTGPAKPEFVIDSPPGCVPVAMPNPDSQGCEYQTLPSGPISGRIKFPYVPDEQYFWDGVEFFSFEQLTFGSNSCSPTPSAWPFNDLYGCEKTFVIYPQMNQEWILSATTSNTANVGTSGLDVKSMVHILDFNIYPSGCGGDGQPCCGHKNCNSGLECGGDLTCNTCGGTKQKCCANNTCKVAGDTCDGAVCKPSCPSLSTPVNVVPGTLSGSPELAVPGATKVTCSSTVATWDGVPGADGYTIEGYSYVINATGLTLLDHSTKPVAQPMIPLDFSILNKCVVPTLLQYRVRATSSCGKMSTPTKWFFVKYIP